MKQEISALMDGELFEDEAEGLLDRVKHHPGAHEDWDIYHLIGDALRQPDYIHGDLSARVHEVLRNEPTILAPRRNSVRQKIRTIALTAAASLSAVGVVVWVSMQVGAEAGPRMRMAMQQNAPRPVSLQIKPKAEDYLMAHQEFSPTTDMNGGVSYIRAVSYRPDEK